LPYAEVPIKLLFRERERKSLEEVKRKGRREAARVTGGKPVKRSREASRAGEPSRKPSLKSRQAPRRKTRRGRHR
jgi:hypothetical protein